ncbi:MAG: acetyl-CoA carboxylase biotin carboxyl carrier protein subunit [Bacteroidales bacterium]|nr:acetyl-CoA carboxylase biotin carboxyl carrier protein subunit [Bacteroidales bacterium]
MKEHKELGVLNIDTTLYKTRISKRFASRKPYKPADPKIIRSFIPGTILDIMVKVGQDVSKGEKLMILDAMKMQNVLICSTDARIKSIAVKKGDKVSKGTLLLEME